MRKTYAVKNDSSVCSKVQPTCKAEKFLDYRDVTKTTINFGKPDIFQTYPLRLPLLLPGLGEVDGEEFLTLRAFVFKASSVANAAFVPFCPTPCNFLGVLEFVALVVVVSTSLP